MTSIDVHQHLLPPALVGVLQRRTSPPRITDGMLELVEGTFPFDPREHDPEARLALLDREGIDLAVLSLQPTLGYDALPDAERAELVAAWEEGILELVAASGGRLAALAAGPARPGFVGRASARTRSPIPPCSSRPRRRWPSTAASSSCTRRAAPCRPADPPGGGR